MSIKKRGLAKGRGLDALLGSIQKEKLWSKLRQSYLSGFMLSCNNSIGQKLAPIMIGKKK